MIVKGIEKDALHRVGPGSALGLRILSSNLKTVVPIGGAVKKRRYSSLPKNYLYRFGLSSVNVWNTSDVTSNIRVLRIEKRYQSRKVVNVPTIAESITECVAGEWIKNKGEYVEKDESVTVIESDKISTHVTSPEAGVIVDIFANAGDTVLVGSKLFIIDTEASKPEASKISAAPPPEKQAEPQVKHTAASESSHQKQSVTQDTCPRLEKTSKQEKKPISSSSSPTYKVSETPMPTQSFSRQQNIVPMTRIRLKIAERLKDAQNQAAFLTTFNEVDMSALINLRQKYGKVFLEKHNVKLGFMGLFLRASAVALLENPHVNALINGKNLIYSDYVDISVAVATQRGLVTPVIRNCESLSVAQIEKELANISVKARQNNIAVEDMAGGTFTISNGGVFGSLFGTPIINPPQTAILGMHSTKKRPIEVDGKVEIRPMMYLALTYDHRVIDGKEAAFVPTSLTPEAILNHCPGLY